MGTSERKPHPALIERLLRDPGAFDFFRAVQVLEEFGFATPTHPAPRRVGADQAQDAVGIRFDTVPSLAFAPRAVDSVAFDEGDGPRAPRYDLRLNFLGLLGAAGTLPRHYSEVVLARLQERDSSLRDYLGLFQDRSAAFFYRVWRKYRVAAAYDRTAIQRGDTDPILTALMAIVGRLPRPRGMHLGASELLEVHHGGLFADQRRSAGGLRALVASLLHCDVAIEQFVGQWVELDRTEWTRLGSGPGSGRPARLGEESVVGTRVWSVDARIRIVAGPLGRARFCALWPGGDAASIVRQAIRSFLGPLIDFDLFWRLAPDAPTPLTLGGDQRLGRDTWLGWDGDRRPDLVVESRAVEHSTPVAAESLTVSA